MKGKSERVMKKHASSGSGSQRGTQVEKMSTGDQQFKMRKHWSQRGIQVEKMSTGDQQFKMKKHWLQSDTQVENMSTGDHQFKKMIVSSVQDASQDQVKLEYERFSWFPTRANDASQQLSKKPQLDRSSLYASMKAAALLRIAKIALEFYQKSQDSEFETLQVMNSHSSRLRLPGSECTQTCFHLIFIAKPKNAAEGSDDDVSPKQYLFGELMQDDHSSELKAQYCSTFVPSNDPGFDHGCMICPPGIHPSSDGYNLGRPPWYKMKVTYY